MIDEHHATFPAIPAPSRKVMIYLLTYLLTYLATSYCPYLQPETRRRRLQRTALSVAGNDHGLAMITDSLT